MRLIVLLAALALVAAGCAGAGESRETMARRYAITLHETQRAGGLGLQRDKEVALTATIELRGNNLVFTAADGEGDPALGASVRAVSGRAFTLDRQETQSSLRGYDVGGGVLQPVEAVLLFQLLAPPQQSTGPSGRTVQLGTTGDPQTPLQAVDTPGGNVKTKGVAARRVATTARADRRLAPTTAYLRLNASYAADPGFEDLFAAPPTLAIPTTTQTVTIPGSSSPRSSPGALGTIINGFGCIATLGLVCNIYPGSGSTTAPRTEATTIAVPGPASLVTTLGGSLSLTSSQVVAMKDGTLLTASGSARMELSGALPSSSGVPAEVAGKTVSVVSEVTYSSRLVSAWPGQRKGPSVVVEILGVLAVLLMCTAAVVGYRRIRSAH